MILYGKLKVSGINYTTFGKIYELREIDVKGESYVIYTNDAGFEYQDRKDYFELLPELESVLLWCEEHSCEIQYGKSFPYKEKDKWVKVRVGLLFSCTRPTLIEAVKQCQLRYSMSPAEYEAKFGMED